MFFQGQLASTINIVNTMADIQGILTGAITSAAGLSASFLGGSTFVSTVAPGWSLFDAAAGTAANGVTPTVIRASLSGSGVLYKHVYMGSISANQLVFNGYETWDGVAHTGTFPTVVTPAGSSWQTVTLTANQSVTISASANHIYIASGVSDTSPNNLVMFAEYSRDDPWNTLANGYHAWVQTGSNLAQGSASAITCNSAITRSYNAAGRGDVSSVLFGTGFNPWATISAEYGPPYSSTGVVAVPSGGAAIGAQISTSGPQAIAAADANKNPSRNLYSVAARQGDPASNSNFLGAWLGGSITTATAGHFYFLANNAAVGGDVITVGTDEYYVARIPLFPTALLAIKRA